MINLHFFPSRRIAFYTVKLFLTRSLPARSAVLILMPLELLGNRSDLRSCTAMRSVALCGCAFALLSALLPFSCCWLRYRVAGLNQHSEVIAMKRPAYRPSYLAR